MEESIGLQTIISENETFKDSSNTINEICNFNQSNKKDQKTFDEDTKDQMTENYTNNNQYCEENISQNVLCPKNGTRKRLSKNLRDGLLNTHGLNETETRDIKKFLKGVGVHTKRVNGGYTDTRWENVSFG